MVLVSSNHDRRRRSRSCRRPVRRSGAGGDALCALRRPGGLGRRTGPARWREPFDGQSPSCQADRRGARRRSSGRAPPPLSADPPRGRAGAGGARRPGAAWVASHLPPGQDRAGRPHRPHLLRPPGRPRGRRAHDGPDRARRAGSGRSAIRGDCLRRAPARRLWARPGCGPPEPPRLRARLSRLERAGPPPRGVAGRSASRAPPGSRLDRAHTGEPGRPGHAGRQGLAGVFGVEV